MKTAMQDLKFFISDGLNNVDETIYISEVWNKVEELLEKEKFQIVRAADYALQHVKYCDSFNPINDGEQYFKEIYKSE